MISFCRFRPRFSVRTLFVLMAALAALLAWLGAERRVVSQRSEARQLIQSLGGSVNDRALRWAISRKYALVPLNADRRAANEKPPPQIPIVRRWLGDEAVGHIRVPWMYTEYDKGRIQALFPEAEVEMFSR